MAVHPEHYIQLLLGGFEYHIAFVTSHEAGGHAVEQEEPCVTCYTVQRSCIAADNHCAEATATVEGCMGRASVLVEQKEIVHLEEGSVVEERSRTSKWSWALEEERRAAIPV